LVTARKLKHAEGVITTAEGVKIELKVVFIYLKFHFFIFQLVNLEKARMQNPYLF